jgi:hypothetical protein
LIDHFFRYGQFPSNVQILAPTAQEKAEKISNLTKTKIIAIDELDYLNSKD